MNLSFSLLVFLLHICKFSVAADNLPIAVAVVVADTVAEAVSVA